MDGLHDDSSLTVWFQLWDQLESSTPGVFVLRIAICISYLIILSICGLWLDVLGILALVSWVNGVNGVGSVSIFGVSAYAASYVRFAARKPRSSGPEDNHSGPVARRQPPAISRLATRTEEDLEEVFRGYLEHLVGNSSSSIAVDYIPCCPSFSQSTTFRSPSADEDTTVKMTLKILDPAFFTRFVHYAHDSEAIFSELTENHMIWVDRPELLPDIFLKKGAPPLQAQGFVDFACFELIRKLRTRPRRLGQSAQATSVDGKSISDIRGFRISSMDAYVLAHVEKRLKQAYRNTVLRLFLADRYFGGSSLGLTFALFTLRLAFWWVSATSLTVIVPLG